MANKPYSFPPSSPMDHLLMQSLMNRLHLRSPSSEDSPNSLFRDLFPQLADDDLPLSDDESTEANDLSDDNRRRRTIAKEEAKLEREIIRIIRAGNAKEALKANSGQSVAVGEHNICVGVHDEASSNYRVWEWHGHIMMFDEEDGFNAEYVYGNHFERLLEKKGKAGKEKGDEEEEVEPRGGSSGLKDLIGDLKDSSANSKGRVLHRNSLTSGSSSK
ncbi:uncharacterized protein LOC110028101 [Phalaenopsis equestris]|uniref:uncharacterized protein LOC110028101 n=1 Tax=Phalaenopsis equestris TaxID=78828 RepID=UPI0009E2A369|nr:uncharacterized protein LOC110028101 [Phalaenopsis equestris]